MRLTELLASEVLAGAPVALCIDLMGVGDRPLLAAGENILQYK